MPDRCIISLRWRRNDALWPETLYDETRRLYGGWIAASLTANLSPTPLVADFAILGWAGGTRATRLSYQIFLMSTLVNALMARPASARHGGQLD